MDRWGPVPRAAVLTNFDCYSTQLDRRAEGCKGLDGEGVRAFCVSRATYYAGLCQATRLVIINFYSVLSMEVFVQISPFESILLK